MASIQASAVYFMAIIIYVVTVNAGPIDTQNATCVMNGVTYSAGEAIGDPCSGCVCTLYGAMCSLREMCPPANCVDKYKPDGECCYKCPNGPNCEYNGPLGRSLIPDSGCRYGHMVCYCYMSQRMNNKLRPYCLPPFPFDFTPNCIIS